MRQALLALLLVGVTGCEPAPGSGPALTVYAAASLTDALQALADSFETAHPGVDVVVNVAATSLLARQIEQGATADVFFSANREWMAYLEARHRIAGPVFTPLGNRLVVVAPEGADGPDSPVALTGVRRLALADPESVPAGLYARQALECLGLWEDVRPRVVPTLDVRAALLSVRHHTAEAAVVYASDARAVDGVQVRFGWPERCRPDVRYAAARLAAARAPDLADAFLRYAVSPARRAFWTRFGFAFVTAAPDSVS